ncbi:acyl-CoA synthetase [Cupriavidus malaysiensis]|uniref:Acyl-CoA synthetase n=1 Tax=Cupriavidus malaysiensis TaxID=367825 RepID=A0A1D9IBP5_9BURK|nr:acyl-CoA synthetase [Cupriavidus malaysiensis]AOZ09532.1 acyl-CoA synthetase [Cupriavidus malaysiensis]
MSGPAPQPAGQPEWSESRERSNLFLLRLMTSLSLRLGRRAARLLLYPITLYFLGFAPRARRASLAYLSRVSGRRARLRDTFGHLLSFASTILDRVYLLNGRFEQFDIRVHGTDVIDAALADGGGAFLLGAHLGSFEVIRAAGRQRPGLQVAITMYEENARKVNDVLQAVNPAMRQDVIALGSLDAMLKVRDYLERGFLVGMLADRTLAQRASDPVEPRDFLGAAAGFPTGPLRIAAMLRRPALFMTGLYLGGNRYEIHFEWLADFSRTPRRDRDAEIEAALARYVAALERHCRAAPRNWFNFYDFWQDSRSGAPASAPR